MPRKKDVMGIYLPTRKEKEAYHWCINNGIFISPFATGEGTWYIDIKLNNNKWHRKRFMSDSEKFKKKINSNLIFLLVILKISQIHLKNFNLRI